MIERYDNFRKVFFSLGSNMGDRMKNLTEAIGHLNERVGKTVQWSSVYETEPWGFSAECCFLNMVIEIETGLSPHQLLEAGLETERNLGRNRSHSDMYESRPIDIDLLLYGQDIIETDRLIVPHPRLHLRRFVLEPLCEIAPEEVHPLLGVSVQYLLDHCPDTSAVKKIAGAIHM